MGTIRKIELFFQEGTSDKVYDAKIVEDGPGTFTVHVEWGRRGSSLNTGAMAERVTRAAADQKFDSLVREKTGKGYQAIAAAVKPAAVAPPEGSAATGGPQLKFRFVKSADVFVTANAGNAYPMGAVDGGKVRTSGKLFAGTTHGSRKELDALPAEGERPVAEVRDLYATDDDVLFQPGFAPLRDDRAPEDCLLSQLARTGRRGVSEGEG